MRQECPTCGITHASAAERDTIHRAVLDVRAWFRTQVLPRPISVPSKRPANAQPVGGPLEEKP